MLTCPRPPRRRPTRAAANAIRRSEMPPRSMISPAKMKSGIATSVAAPLPAATCCTSTSGGRPSQSSVASEEAANACATGTPSASNSAHAVISTSAPLMRAAP